MKRPLSDYLLRWFFLWPVGRLAEVAWPISAILITLGAAVIGKALDLRDYLQRNRKGKSS